MHRFRLGTHLCKQEVSEDWPTAGILVSATIPSCRGFWPFCSILHYTATGIEPTKAHQGRGERERDGDNNNTSAESNSLRTWVAPPEPHPVESYIVATIFIPAGSERVNEWRYGGEPVAGMEMLRI